MATEVHIRAATLKDVSDIREMIAALAVETGHSDIDVMSEDDIRAHGFGPHPDFNTLIAEQDGRAIGLVVYFGEFSTWRGKRGVYVQDIYVAPEQQGLGVGRLLINAVSARAQESGAVYIRLAADRSNVDAHQFYKRLGFQEKSDDSLFILEGDAFQTFAKGRA